MDKLPAIVKSRAMGGGGFTPAQGLALPAEPQLARKTPSACSATCLQGLESRLQSVQSSVEKRNKLAAATPSIWPATGWLTSSMGARRDPFTGEPDFHPGLDISADTVAGLCHGRRHGRPCRTYSAYGNLVRIDHGFGLESRYGHLSTFTVEVGARVKRGDLIGMVGATGRATARTCTTKCASTTASSIRCSSCSRTRGHAAN